MARLLFASAADFEPQFAALLRRSDDTDARVDAAVADIIRDVRAEGDAAVIRYTERFDRLSGLTPGNLRLADSEIDALAETVPADTMDALRLAARRIRAYHEQQLPQPLDYIDDQGVRLGYRWTPVQSAGLYVPGGKAAYPSSVLMNAIPAKVAGVARLAMTVPTPDGILNPLVMAAARLAEIDEIYRIGGAQAVAALAYGTDSIPAVDKITGPGNAYVASAKKQVFGQVGIDMIAGPSEILVVADDRTPADWIAADLLSQAEHDEAAQSVLITDSEDFARAVEQAVTAALAIMPRADIATASWRDFGAIIVVDDLMADAPALIDRIAPEHLELAVDEPDALAERVRNAGAIFIGRYTPEAIGDYVAGPNHVLPTAHSARFSSGLSVLDFMKRSTLLACDAEALAAIGPAAVQLAEAEGLKAHGRSVSIRLNRSV